MLACSEVLHRDLKPSNIFLSGRSAGSAHYIHEEDSTALQSGPEDTEPLARAMTGVRLHRRLRRQPSSDPLDGTRNHNGGNTLLSQPRGVRAQLLGPSASSLLCESWDSTRMQFGHGAPRSQEALASCVETGVGTTHLKIGFATTDTTRSIIQQSPGDRVPMAGREHQRGRRAALCFVAASLGWHSAFSRSPPNSCRLDSEDHYQKRPTPHKLRQGVLSTGEQRFLLVRHGQTTFNAEKRFQGCSRGEC